MYSIYHIADHDCSNDPAVKEALKLQTYVDDVFITDTSDELLEAQVSLINVLNRAGFPLKKWLSKLDKVLENVPFEDRLVYVISMDGNEGGIPKVLGLRWKPREDAFSYTITLDTRTASTKRKVLSVIARLFGPLGFLSPIVFLA